MEQEIFGDDVVMLVDEDGNNIRFEQIGSCELEGKLYFALVPVDDNKDDEYVILRQEADENGETTFVTIEDDEEFDRVADYFDDMLFGEVDYDQTEEAPEEK